MPVCVKLGILWQQSYYLLSVWTKDEFVHQQVQVERRKCLTTLAASAPRKVYSGVCHVPKIDLLVFLSLNTLKFLRLPYTESDLCSVKVNSVYSDWQ